MLIVLILGGLVAVGIGIWLGLPGDTTVAEREIERAIKEGEGGGPSKKVKRQFMGVEWLMHRAKGSQVRKSREPVRKPFDLVSNENSPKKAKDQRGAGQG